jgi:pyruvate dehydrogenase E2 component (dihydrolipoamide acetyltransferase)
VNIDHVRGTGPGGRVIKKDIESFLVGSGETEQQSSAARVEVEQISQLRKIIAGRMSTALRETASMTVFDEADKGIKLTYLAFIVKAVTQPLILHPSVNAELDLIKGILMKKKYYNIGIAVDTPDGLVVPVIKDADRKNVTEIAAEIPQLAEKARTRKISFEEMKDGTFSIGNYGPIGGRFATPIINYPQAAILGVGRARVQPVVLDGGVVPGTVLPLSLTADHRILDGGEATRFLNDCIRFLSDPVRMVLG